MCDALFAFRAAGMASSAYLCLALGGKLGDRAAHLLEALDVLEDRSWLAVLCQTQWANPGSI